LSCNDLIYNHVVWSNEDGPSATVQVPLIA